MAMGAAAPTYNSTEMQNLRGGKVAILNPDGSSTVLTIPPQHRGKYFLPHSGIGIKQINPRISMSNLPSPTFPDGTTPEEAD